MTPTRKKTSRRASSPPATAFSTDGGGLTQDEAFRRLNVVVDLLPAGASNRPGTRLNATHVTIHNTANASPGADARMHARYMRGPDARAREVSWHFTVDDRMCVKHLPTTEKGWHAGPGNSRSVAIEICEHAGIDKEAAMDRAALLTAVLMLALGIPPERVVPHQFWTGKDCPHVVLREPGGFEAFRQRAAGYLDQLNTRAAFAPAAFAPAAFALEAGTMEASGADLSSLVEVESDAASAGGSAAASFGASAFGASAFGASDVPSGAMPSVAGGMDPREHVAHLERLVGRLALENHLLRSRVAGMQDATREAE